MSVGVVETVVWMYKVTRITDVSPEVQTTCQPVILLDNVQTRPATEYPENPGFERVASKN